MRILRKIRDRNSRPSRGHHELARALRAAPTLASREELRLLQNR